MTEIDASTIKNWIESNDIQLIDIRKDDEFDERNIGRLNIPLASLPLRFNEIDPKQKTVLICQIGKRYSLAFATIIKEYPNMDIYH